jgi:voltage-gated potassium channel Kch
MGVSLGHIAADALGLVTMVGLITIASSTYLITYSHQIYPLFEPVLGVFERRGTPREPVDAAHRETSGYDVLVFGLGRFGTAIGVRLKNRGMRVLGVDFNPIAVRRWRALGLAVEYGDATDPEFLSSLPLARARWVVATIPVHPTGLSHEDARITILQTIREAAFRGRIAVTSHSSADTGFLLQSGADRVLEPFQDAADRAVELLSGGEVFERTEIPEIETEEKSLPGLHDTARMQVAREHKNATTG